MFYTSNGEPDFHKIWKELRKAGYLIMVSDGSVRLIWSMTYGWILATPEGKWLAAANGPSMDRGSSLRAEGDGMLSATLFASIIADEYSSETCTIKYISDNQALIRQCEEHLEF